MIIIIIVIIIIVIFTLHDLYLTWQQCFNNLSRQISFGWQYSRTCSQSVFLNSIASLLKSS